ncbi:MAG TPA: hypothetical protein VMW27_15125 [Thermoanaerobaculia bacterium]|nr:hypothetical protein [Thermoanaerobaculia bacterium]
MPKFLLLPLAFVFVVLAESVHPQAQAVACGPYCDTAGGSTTPTATAIGSSCTVAQSNLTSQLKSYGNSYCGFVGSCQLVVTTTVACHATGGGYSVSGYATFGCRDSTC